MSHHSNLTPDCPLCADKLEQAHPQLKDWYLSKVKPAHPDVHISWSYRDKASQEQAFQDGKSELHYPMSAHNKTDAQGKPCAMALDLFRFVPGKPAEFPQTLYAQIAQAAERACDPIKWGGHWKSLGDADHFQLSLPK
jgi:hypothetical protein